MTRRLSVAVLLAAAALSACGRADFTSDVGTVDVESALAAEAVEICASVDAEARAAGATAERRYDVAVDCDDREETGATVVVTTFEDAEARDGAARRFEVGTRGTASGAVWTLGPLLVRVGGDRDPEAVDRVTEALDGLGAR